MRLEFHKQVACDISRDINRGDYYEKAAGPELADEFYAALQSCFQRQPTLLSLIRSPSGGPCL